MPRAPSDHLPDLTSPAIELAPALLGCRLVRTEAGRRRTGVIVETEAYPGGPDLASHTRLGLRTPRNEAMWREGGHAYVYFTYGVHWMFNIVSGPEGAGEAVLIRALEPVEGLDRMGLARTRDVRRPCGVRDLCRGPARLTQALGISRAFDGIWLPGHPELRLEGRAEGWSATVAVGPRVGVAYAGRWAREPWRFSLVGCRYVSNPLPK